MRSIAFFCDFATFNPESILDSILDPPGLPFGSLLAPKVLETCLEIPPGRPKSRSEDLFSAPRNEKEGSKKESKKGTKKGWLRRFKMGQDGMTGGMRWPGLS